MPLLVIFRLDELATLSPYIFVQTRFISTRLSIEHAGKLALLRIDSNAIPLRGRNTQLHLPAAWHPDDSEPAIYTRIDASGVSVGQLCALQTELTTVNCRRQNARTARNMQFVSFQRNDGITSNGNTLNRVYKIS